MPTPLHEQIIELLRRAPDVAVEVARRATGLSLPAFAACEIRPGEIRELLPPERRVDVVVQLGEEVPVFLALFEVQMSPDPDKQWTWPYYLCAHRAAYECPVALIVICPSAATRAWARTPIETGHPGFAFAPLVVGPEEIPRVTDEHEALASPYRAILSALMHAAEPDVAPVMVAAFRGASSLPARETDTWREILALALQSNEVAREAVESIMDIENFRDHSVWFKEGQELGRAGGVKDGREEGALAYARSAIERVLAKRGLVASEPQRSRIAACDQVAVLDRWLEAAAVASSVEEALRLDQTARRLRRRGEASPTKASR